jgi:hypothetical protein
MSSKAAWLACRRIASNRCLEVRRGWVWVNAESGDPAVAIDAEDHRTMVNVGLLVKRPIVRRSDGTAVLALVY